MTNTDLASSHTNSPPSGFTRKHVEDSFRRKFSRSCSAVARAPGRVNLLGEHVDYNEGLVLPVAIDRATYVAYSSSETDQINIWALDYDEQAVFSIESLGSKTSIDGKPLPEWARYPAGVAWALLHSGRKVKGLNAVFASDVPQGAGLSSSASVELAFATVWKDIDNWTTTPMELAVLCQTAENSFVGVNCGIMDQAASACGKEGHILLLDCRTLGYRALPMPAGVMIVIADTGIHHALAASEYNNRREACESAVRILRQDLPDITSLRDVHPSDLSRLAGRLPDVVQMRARHVVEEIDRTHLAVPMLLSGDVVGFGRLMNACHVSLRDLYQVSCPELDTMASIAQSLDGCYGARLTGAGFGGCTVNLVAREQVGAFNHALGMAYRKATGSNPEIHVCEASAGAGIINLVTT